MARIRTIKPEFWTDERVGECSVSARLLLLAALNFADDYGGLDRSSKQLKAQAFPYDNIDCEPLVAELLNAKLFIEYEAGGRKYLHIKGFRKHQRVEKPAKPRIPLYEEKASPPLVLPEQSPTTPRVVTVSSSEGKGKDIKKPRAERVGSRLPEDFKLTPERQQIAEAEGLDPSRAFQKFTNHWRAASGAKGVKADWDATWCNWCLQQADFDNARKPKEKPQWV